MQNSHLLQAFREEGDEVSKSEIAYGYKMKGHDYLVFDKKEIDAAKPSSTKLIELKDLPEAGDEELAMMTKTSECTMTVTRRSCAGEGGEATAKSMMEALS